MDIELAKHARMSERGSSLLRMMQNEEMPILDLLVRESVQNSLDAADRGYENVDMTFKTGSFEKRCLIESLEGIGWTTEKYYPENSYEFISISDKNTVGLTGPLHIDEVDDQFGNLMKLVYEISMPQSQDGSGGSWGLGKTIYFRIGIGLVLYYSRIKKGDDSYEERLAACLVEDETKTDTLLPAQDGKPKRGIAWWGKRVDDGSTIPITDKNEIIDILKIFNIKPYEENETGTTIIMPFIKKDSLISTYNDKTEGGFWWEESAEEYLKVALQRWYAPRIDNEFYTYGSWLKVRVNDYIVKKDKMNPVFKAIQALYNRTFFEEKKLGKDILNGKHWYVKEVNLRKDLLNNEAGKIAYIKLNRNDLLMGPPDNNPSPFNYINIRDINDIMNPPLICFVRKPAMIANYEVFSRWTEGIDKTNEDEFILGIFVPDSNNRVKTPGSDMSLEEYLRKSEKSDHTSWSDINLDGKHKTIVTRIQRNSAKVIKETYSEKKESTENAKKSALGKTLAQFLLPPSNFGNAASIGRKGNVEGKEIIRKTKDASFSVDQQIDFIGDKIKLNFELQISETVKNSIIELNVLSETGQIKSESWESDSAIGTKFPVEISKIEINEINGKSQKLNVDNYTVLQAEGTEIKCLRTRRYGSHYAVKISNRVKTKNKIRGCIYLLKSDDYIQSTLVMNYNKES